MAIARTCAGPVRTNPGISCILHPVTKSRFRTLVNEDSGLRLSVVKRKAVEITVFLLLVAGTAVLVSRLNTLLGERMKALQSEGIAYLESRLGRGSRFRIRLQLAGRSGAPGDDEENALS